MAAYLGYTLRMKTLFRGWPVMGSWHAYEKKKISLSGNRPVTVWEMLINLLEIPTAMVMEYRKVIRDPYSGLDQHQKLISSSDW